MNTRKKGVQFEREVAAAFEAAGFEVRGLEGGGDHLVVARDGAVLHLEAKRREHLKLDTWLRQQEADCPAPLRRALVFRLSRRPAYAVEPLDQFVAREAALAELEELRRRLRAIAMHSSAEHQTEEGKARALELIREWATSATMPPSVLAP